MAMNYYTLVAGLKEYTLESDKKGFDARDIISEIRPQLTDKDKSDLTLFYNYYDISNILSLRAGRDQFNTLGNYLREELEEALKDPLELFPGYIGRIIYAYANPEDADFDDIDRSLPQQKSLFEAFYQKCENSDSHFIRDWYEFDRNLRNITAAYTARRLGLPISEQLVGGGYVSETLARSSAADFGLWGEFDYLDEVTDAVSAESNFLEKERRLDLIRWDKAEDLATFDYFNINGILSYLARINIVHSWLSLDPQYGREMFRRLMDSFTSREVLERAEKENAK